MLFFPFNFLNLLPVDRVQLVFAFFFDLPLKEPSPEDVFVKTLTNVMIAMTGFLAMRLLLNRNVAVIPDHHKILISFFISLMPFILIGGMIYWGDSASKAAIHQTFVILSLSLLAFLLTPLIGARFSKKAQPTWGWLESGLMLLPTSLFWAFLLFYSALNTSTPPNLNY